MSMDAMPKFAEFFSGAGMVRSGLDKDWELAFANDIDPKKCRSCRANWGSEGLIEGDIKDLDTRLLRQSIDLYWASSPCQDLSLAGTRSGLGGQRSSVFFTWMSHVAEAKRAGFSPKILAFENVTGLITSNDGRDFVAVAKAFQVQGYRFGALEIDARHFLPQSRPRVFMIGIRQDLALEHDLTMPRGQGAFHSERLRRFEADMPASLRKDWIWWNLPIPRIQPVRLESLIDLEHPDVMSPYATQCLIEMMNEPSFARLSTAKAAGGVHIGTIYKRGRPDQNGYVRQRAEVRFDGLAGCLRTPAGGSSRQTLVIVRDGTVITRLLTAREAVRLMGLPDTYILPSSYNEGYKLAGDGVAVPVVRHLSTHLFEKMLNSKRDLAAA